MRCSCSFGLEINNLSVVQIITHVQIHRQFRGPVVIVMATPTERRTVSVIIPTYNRYDACMRAIAAAQNQTLKPLEILVVDDGSTDPRYAQHAWDKEPLVKYLRQPKNTRMLFGFVNISHVRNQGLRVARGYWIATCDDDDMWLPHKLERQVTKLEATGADMCSTEAYTGEGPYNPQQHYPTFYGEAMRKTHELIFRQKRKRHLLRPDGSLPDVFSREFINTHNCMMTPTVIVHRELLQSVGGFQAKYPPGEDYATWKAIARARSLRASTMGRPDNHVLVLFIREPCAYHDNDHDGGSAWLNHTRAHRSSLEHRKQALQEQGLLMEQPAASSAVGLFLWIVLAVVLLGAILWVLHAGRPRLPQMPQASIVRMTETMGTTGPGETAETVVVDGDMLEWKAKPAFRELSLLPVQSGQASSP